jgi:biopolymer transport protein ExbD
MGVQVEGGKGRGKGMMVDLNLVPFIDFMSCLIAFLMITAVWTEIHSLNIEQNVSPPDQPPEEIPPPDEVPPLTVHVRGDGHWIGRKVEEGTNIPKLGDSYDYVKLEEVMAKDHETYPDKDQVIINTDDGVKYEEMVKVLDMSRKVGYPKTLLAGSAPQAVPPELAVPSAPAPG